jgi:hypothetical protein
MTIIIFMKTILSTCAVAFALSPCLAVAEGSEFPLEAVRAYDGASFEVNVPCVERAVRDFLGSDISSFNSEVGVISGQAGPKTAIVILSGELPESDLARVDGVVFHQGEGHSSIRHDGLQGSFMHVTGREEVQPFATYNAQSFEAYIKSCSPTLVMS